MTQQSPTDEITFRRPSASPPTFSGLTPSLPSALRHLRQQNTPKQPSEMTILANRLHSIHIDESPFKGASPNVPPQKLFFDSKLDQQSHPDAANSKLQTESDKENPIELYATPVVSTDSHGLLSNHASPNVEKAVEPSEGIDTPHSATKFVSMETDRKISCPENASAPSQSTPLTDAPSYHIPDKLSQCPGPTCDSLDTAAVDPSLHAPHVSFSASIEHDESVLLKHVEKIEQGKTKWKWPERCESLRALAAAVSKDPNDSVVSIINERMTTLATKIDEHLNELRPSVITAALLVIDAFVTSSLPSTEFSVCVFPTVVKIALGHSLTAQNAAHSLVLCISNHRTPHVLLDQVGDLPRIENVISRFLQSTKLSEDVKAASDHALSILTQRLVQTRHSTPVQDSSPTTPQISISTGTNGVAGTGIQSERKSVCSSQVGESTPRTDREADMRSEDRVRSLRLSRMSWRAKLESPALSKRPPLASGNYGHRHSTENKSEASGSLNTPSTAHGRMYSKDEVEEIRQTAIEAVIERLDQEHKEERDRLHKEKIEVERNLDTERNDNSELRGVLEEYELTMKRMISETNTHMNEQQTALESENSRLKGQLLSTNEAFEKLKEKYEATKQALERMETKEVRMVEQNQELKKSMIELQQWSNDLRANTEKKLTKAFESVTSYRAMVMDREAHERKAISDAEKMKSELEKSAENLRQTVTKLAQCESDLHREQDARADINGQLSSSKATIVRLTSQREELQLQVDKHLQTMAELNQRVRGLEETVARMADTKKQLETLKVERQELKARAFDDMKRMEIMERELQMKDKEIEEMNMICDQAVSELERCKHASST